MNTKFYDLEISEHDDGTIELVQHVGCDDPYIIYLHPIQAACIADGVPATVPNRPQPSWITERISTLERRLVWMRDRFEECNAALPPNIFERCADAPEFAAWLQASLDVATEYCADLASEFPASPVAALSERMGGDSISNHAEAALSLTATQSAAADKSPTSQGKAHSGTKSLFGEPA